MATWKKGALHTHSSWSDGRAIPEVVLTNYKKLGYDFVSITDHNLFQSDPNVWQWISYEGSMFGMAFTADAYEWTKEMLGENAEQMLDVKTIGSRTYIRMKDYEAFRAQFEEPGKFLVMPGNEITIGGFKNSVEGWYVTHLNSLNLKAEYPELKQIIPQDAPQSEVYRTVYESYKEKAGDALEDTILMANHPFWIFWDCDPSTLLDVPEIKFFEVCNSGAREDAPRDPMLTIEKFWDFVLAHRLDRGQGMIYATATDDTHYHHVDKARLPGFVDTGFVVVNCPGEFTYKSIIAALKRGDFYASCGVYLDDVVFDKETKTLNVKVKAEEGVNYRVEFITTKRDFDRTIKKQVYKFEKPFFNREMTVVPENIGVVVKTVEGCEASYTMADDDMYVRAVIYSDKKGRIDNPFYYPEFECAWTQPVC